jgi:Toprim domain
MLTFEQARDLTGCKFGVIDAPCPLCGPERRSSINQRRKTLRLWCSDPEFISFHCARCEQRGWASALRNSRPASQSVDAFKILAEIQQRDDDETRERLGVALSLWRRRQLMAGTAAETYLREVRKYRGELPATLGFLPASAGFAPAMIAAFGLAHETEPGVLVINDDDVRGVHLTSLKPDGRGKAGTDRDKIFVGKSIGFPIVLAAVNDGLGLAITEGIEDALSVHDATGLGAWAAGAASRMPALARQIPTYVECVTIAADDDDAGRDNAEKLAAAIPTQNCSIRLIIPSQSRAAA